MKRCIRILLILILSSGFAFSQAKTELKNRKATHNSRSPNGSAKLQGLFADYWENYLADNPGFANYLGDSRYDNKLYDISEKAYRRRYATARRFLKRANAISDTEISPQEQMSLRLLRRNLALAIEGEPLHSYLEDNYLMPINQIEGFHLTLLGLPQSHSFASARDYRTYIESIRTFPARVDAAIENMRKGVSLGITLPKAVVELIIPELESGVTTDATHSPLYEPTKRFPPSVSAADKKRLTASIERETLKTVTPGYRKLLEFIKNEYLPKARPTFAYSDLPGGREMYAYAIKVRTTTGLSADELHDLGLKELERISLERQKLLKEIGFEGTIGEFNQRMQVNKDLRLFDASAVERNLRENLQFIEARLPKLFSNIPELKYEIRPVETFRAASFPNGQYIPPSMDGSRPGIFYYNTYNIETEGVRKFILPNLAFHEAVPGHGLGAVYGRMNKELPAFRRYWMNAAYDEGWATYAEGLADELGAYRDPYARNFWLNAETFTYIGLVVETAIHTKGWTREQAYAFVRKYLPMPEARFDLFMARWTVLPAQGMAYSVGALRIRRLREQAERELGSRFDVREFHDVVLTNGTVPLDVLTELVEAWIERTKAQD